MNFLSKYKKPILLVGTGARSANAINMIHEFVKKTNIPLLTTMNAVDIALDNLHIGFIGTHGNRVANMILSHCDIIISVGARLGIRQVGRFTKNFAPQADLVRVDIDENELSRNIKPNEIKYHTDARDFMRMLLDEDITDFSSWRCQCLEAKKILDQYDKQPGNYAIEKIGSLLPEDPIVTVDVGVNQCWTAQSLVLKGYKGRILIGGGYGTMGCGLPYAIGASISRNSGIVYCIVGDGGMQMNIQELQTVKRENLPIKIFILNNHVLGKISETQYYDLNGRFAMTTESGGYTVPDFQKISEAYGIKAVTLNDYNSVDFYKSWIIDDDPCVFNIILPKTTFLTPKIRWETCKFRPELEQGVVDKVNSILSK